MTTTGPISPQQGDVVITRDAERGNAYTISVVPGHPQFCYSTYEEALAVVMKWARRQPLAVWFTEDSKIFTALEPASQPTPHSGRPRTRPRGQ